MEHISALGIKLIMVTLILGITLGLIGGADFGQVLLASAMVTLIAYVVGDLIILPATSNWIAVLADAGLVWATLRLMFATVAMGWPLLLSVVGLAIGEYFFHAYMKESVLTRP